jgi:hypothetical protein
VILRRIHGVPGEEDLAKQLADRFVAPATKLVKGDRVKARTTPGGQVLGESESQGRIERGVRLTAEAATTDFCREQGPGSDEV